MIRLPVLLSVFLLQTAGSPTAPPRQQAADSVPATVAVQEESELDRKVREIAAELRCPFCQSQSLLESNSSLAQEMRVLIREKLEAGETPEEIKAYFVKSYSDWILLDPRPQGFNLAVYILPIVAVLAGMAILWLAIRRWTRAAPAAAAPQGIDETDPDLAAWEG